MHLEPATKGQLRVDRYGAFDGNEFARKGFLQIDTSVKHFSGTKKPFSQLDRRVTFVLQ
ncbi:unnamed protein product [Acidithrix sp. C25]|nr:unnamed protein product [Acidithrix sp. C25]